jgi:polysaccharide deacetylase family protein (PEP-CTERM system associated)
MKREQKRHKKNILTFDIEEWYLQKAYFGGKKEKYAEYDRYLDLLLNKLDKQGYKATFFCVGGMATDFPEVVRKIEGRGHEIGCHSFRHVWLNKMTEKEVLEDTRTAVDALEQCIGKKVLSYRAPAFSIGNQNKWAFTALVECGIMRDASIFPAERDFGGFPQFGKKVPTMVFSSDVAIKEFPICTTTLLGHEMAYSGGGYFRFFPLNYIRREMSKSDYNMTYFHIGDLVPESSGVAGKGEYERYYKEPGTLKNRYMRYIKTNLGKKKAFDKLMKLLELESFVSLEQADAMMNWSEAPSVVL